MKFAIFLALAATASAVKIESQRSHVPTTAWDRSSGEDKPKTYVWEKKLAKQTQGTPKTQEEIDASWDGDLGFTINMGGEKFDTKLNYDNSDKFQVQSIIDYYSNHELKEPWKQHRE